MRILLVILILLAYFLITAGIVLPALVSTAALPVLLIILLTGVYIGLSVWALTFIMRVL